MKCENRQLNSYTACAAAESEVVRDPTSVNFHGHKWEQDHERETRDAGFN